MPKYFLALLFFLFSLPAFATVETIKIDAEDGLSTYTTGVSQDIDDAKNQKSLRVGLNLKKIPFLGTIARDPKDKTRHALVYETKDGKILYRYHLLLGLLSFEKNFDIDKDKRIQGKPKGWVLELGQKPLRYVAYANDDNKQPLAYHVQVKDETDGQKKYARLKKLAETYAGFDKMLVKIQDQNNISLKDLLKKQTSLSAGDYVFQLDVPPKKAS